MNINDLLNLQPQKSPKDPRAFSTMLVGESKIGKTTFMADFYGKEKTLFIATEDRHKALVGANVWRVGNWSDFIQTLNMLQTAPQLKEKYKYVVIDTLDNLMIMAEKYAASQYGVEILGQSNTSAKIKFSEDYRYYNTLFKKFKEIQDSGYVLSIITHAVKETRSVRWSNLSDEDKKTLEEIGITIDDRDKKGYVSYPVYNSVIKKDALREFTTGNIDNVLFLTHKGIDNKERIIKTQKDLLNDCAVTTFDKEFPAEIPLDAQKYKEEIEKYIARLDPEMVSDEEYQQKDVTLNFKEIMSEVKELGKKLQDLGKMQEVKDISDEIFGTEIFMTKAKETQAEQLKVALDKMKVLYDNTEGK